MLIEKAKDFGVLFGARDFNCSLGWLVFMIYMIREAWCSVTSTTIENCWKHTQIMSNQDSFASMQLEQEK